MGRNSNSYLQHADRDPEAKENNHLSSKLRPGAVVCDRQSSDLLFVSLVHFFFLHLQVIQWKAPLLRDGGEPGVLT